MRDWLLIAGAGIGSGIVGGLIGGFSVILGVAEPLIILVVGGSVLFAAGALFWMGMLTRKVQRKER